MIKRFSFIVGFFLLAGLSACNEENALFGPIGNTFSAPISVSVDVANNRAYVVNSNNNYAFTDTTLSVLDITDPEAPVLLSRDNNPLSIPNYSGISYYDTATLQLYVTNRLSDNADDDIDQLLRINMDESSPSFGDIDSFATGANPFGLVCCDTSSRFYVVNGGVDDGAVGVYPLADPSTSVQVSLRVQVDSTIYEAYRAADIVLLGTQAFVTSPTGQFYVLNTDEIGDSSKNPVDYIVTEAEILRGIATDGTLLYVVEEDNDDPLLRVINPTTLTPVTPDTAATTLVDINTIQERVFALGENPQQVLVYGSRVFVTNLDDDTVTVINLTTNQLEATLVVGDQPFGLTAFLADGTNYLYVTNLFSNNITIVNLDTLSVVATYSP